MEGPRSSTESSRHWTFGGSITLEPLGIIGWSTRKYWAAETSLTQHGIAIEVGNQALMLQVVPSLGHDLLSQACAHGYIPWLGGNP